MDTTFKGRAKRLDDIDLPRIGHLIGVGEDELHAFIDVEASGAPFDGQGRPKMLFEPHLFYAQLGKGAKRDRAVKEGLAYPKWKPGAYPAESYTRLLKAMKIDEAAALMSCSWGGSQILGKWFADCGYVSVQDMVTAFMDDAENHLNCSVRLIVKWGIDDDLRRLRALSRPTRPADCAQIAETWNGEGYAVHNYHGRLADRHNHWREIRDTPFDPAKDMQPVPPVPPATNTNLPDLSEPAPPIEPAPAPVPVVDDENDAPAPQAPVANKGGIIAAIVLLAGAAAVYVANLPCNWFGVLCQ